MPHATHHLLQQLVLAFPFASAPPPQSYASCLLQVVPIAHDLARTLSVAPCEPGLALHRHGCIHYRNLLAQLRCMGPKSPKVSLLTVFFIGMAFTTQFMCKLTNLGL